MYRRYLFQRPGTSCWRPSTRPRSLTLVCPARWGIGTTITAIWAVAGRSDGMHQSASRADIFRTPATSGATVSSSGRCTGREGIQISDTSFGK